MKQLALAYNDAVNRSNGRFPQAAALLAESLKLDDSLRLEAAAALIGTMLHLSRPSTAERGDQ